MSMRAIHEYYDATVNRNTRPDLLYAVEQVSGPRIAIDCGCGAGADIAYLLEQGFTIHGFDIEQESIDRCKQRFGNQQAVKLTQADFGSFQYPSASLVVADASLFFCPPSQFDEAWDKIYECLCPDGIFCGSFLGPEDSMADPENDGSRLWPDVLIIDEDQVRRLFKGYEVHRLTEHKSTGSTPQGVAHHWHLYSVVARKVAH